MPDCALQGAILASRTLSVPSSHRHRLVIEPRYPWMSLSLLDVPGHVGQKLGVVDALRRMPVG